MPTDESRDKPSLTNQSIWILFAKVLGFVLSVLIPLLVVRYLEQSEVGVYRQAFLIIVNATAILPFGLSMGAYYFLNRRPEDRRSTVLNIILWNTIVGLLVCVLLSLFPELLGHIFQGGQLAALSPLIGAAIALALFSAFLEIVVLANQEPRLATLIIIWNQCSKTILFVIAVVLFSSAMAIVCAAIIHGLIQAVILALYLRSRFPGLLSSIDISILKIQLSYSLPFGLAGVLYIAQSDLHLYFVGYRFDSTTYAIYVYGCFELPLIWALYESISVVLLPRMSELASRENLQAMRDLWLSAMRKLAMVYFPLFVFFSIVAERLFITLFTENYLASVPIFRINLILLPIYCLIIDPIERAFKDLGIFLMKVRIFVIATLSALLFYGLAHFSLRGMILSVVAVAILERLISLWRVLGVLDVRFADIYLFKDILRTALAAAASGMVFFVLYLFGEDVLLFACQASVQPLLRLTHSERIAEFIAGCEFLAVACVVYSLIYLVFLRQFQALKPEDQARFREFISVKRRRVRSVFTNLAMAFSRPKES